MAGAGTAAGAPPVEGGSGGTSGAERLNHFMESNLFWRRGAKQLAFVAGDLARFEQDGAPVPGVAPAVHIFFLIGFRNRFVVMFDWALAYATYDRHARLILETRLPIAST